MGLGQGHPQTNRKSHAIAQAVALASRGNIIVERERVFLGAKRPPEGHPQTNRKSHAIAQDVAFASRGHRFDIPCVLVLNYLRYKITIKCFAIFVMCDGTSSGTAPGTSHVPRNRSRRYSRVPR